MPVATMVELNIMSFMSLMPSSMDIAVLIDW